MEVRSSRWANDGRARGKFWWTALVSSLSRADTETCQTTKPSDLHRLHVGATGPWTLGILTEVATSVVLPSHAANTRNGTSDLGFMICEKGLRLKHWTSMAMHGCRMKIFAYESIFFRLSGQVAWAPISQPWRGVFGLELVIAGFMVRFSCNVRLSESKQ